MGKLSELSINHTARNSDFMWMLFFYRGIFAREERPWVFVLMVTAKYVLLEVKFIVAIFLGYIFLLLMMMIKSIRLDRLLGPLYINITHRSQFNAKKCLLYPQYSICMCTTKWWGAKLWKFVVGGCKVLSTSLISVCVSQTVVESIKQKLAKRSVDFEDFFLHQQFSVWILVVIKER